FDAWSRKSPKHNAYNPAKKWAALFKSPPTQIGAGTIFHLADQAAPGWQRARTEEPPPAEPPLGCDLGKALVASLRPTILDCDGAPLDPTQFAEPLRECGDPLVLGRTRARAQEPDGR